MSTKQHKTRRPPKWADRLLESFCAPHLLEEVLGDLHERYDLRANRLGEAKAKRLYWREVMAFLRPSIFKNTSSHYSKPIFTDMIRNYFKIALRGISSNKAFSTINIIGLALGMTCFMFIYLWVQDEQAVDNFHDGGKNLYNVYQKVHSNGEVTGSYTSPVRYDDKGQHMVLADIKKAIPEVELINFYATGYELPWGHPETFQVGEKIHKLEGSRAEADFFKMFNYEVIAGHPETALEDLSSIAISRKMAGLFFDSPEDAIGQSIRYENQLDFAVTAVFEDVSPHSSLKFDFLINWKSQMSRLEWASHQVLTTIKIAENADVEQVENKINAFLKTRLDENEPFELELGLQRYGDQYLISNFVNGEPKTGRITYVKIFSGIAIFILLIACINFMNLATARSIKRAKEVGVRKVIGSSRIHLIGQFLGESILLSAFALGSSLLLIQLLLPGFNQLTGKQTSLPLMEPTFWMVLIALTLITGFFAGSYPALFLSSLKPARVLKGVVRNTNSSIWFRKGLSIFQFGLSIMLLIATLVVSRQTKYVQQTKLGYDRENLIYFRIEGDINNQYSTFKERASRMPGIAMIDRSSEAPHAMGFVIDDPGLGYTGENAINWEGKEEGVSVGFKPASVGFDFLKIMNLEILQGRDFSREASTDSAEAFMVNEEAVRQMGMENPIGKWISAWKKKGRIIAVLKDYHTHSLHEPIKPLIIDVKEYEYFGVIMVRTEPGKTKEALTSLEKIYKEINPNYPFNYQFVDQEYEALYKSEQVITKLSNTSAGLAILISCLGMLGLAMFSAEQRTKEIGIRKVLGASVSSILNLFSQDFLKLVSISFIIAAPISAVIMSRWLESYAYKIDLAWWIFALAGLVIMMVALLTVSFQSLKAALSNPIDSLRDE